MGFSSAVNDDRYNRQKLIPEWNQEIIDQSTVLILGVGALGSVLAVNLALTGVRKLILVDFDTIELSNLNRQLLFSDVDIGKNKAEVAVEKLKLVNPHIEVEAHPYAMEDLPKKVIKQIDIIASCLDTFQGRRWANSLAIREKKPLVTGGMYGFMGNVQVVLPYETACFECQPLIPQEKLAQACSPLGDTRKELELEKEEAIPAVATLSSIIAGMMAQELLKTQMNIGSIINNYLFYDGLSNGFTELELQRNPNCPMCGSKYNLEEQEILAFEGEPISDFRTRIALALGLANPSIMVKGKILQNDEEMHFQAGTKCYITDERLAKPIALIMKFEED